MTSNMPLSAEQKNATADAMTQILADTFTLYYKTHTYHWNVVGPHFPTLHALFEEQYQMLWKNVDDIAERVRALDAFVPAGGAGMTARSHIREAAANVDAMDMVRELAQDHETIAATIRAGIAVFDEAGDVASTDLVTEYLTYHDKQRWMLQAMAA